MAGVSRKIVRDDISPKLSKLAATGRHPRKVFRAMGTTFMNITMGAFNSLGKQSIQFCVAKGQAVLAAAVLV
jgi:hypothetical protein